MASPEELELEQKLRALKLKEDALDKQSEQQIKTEKRIKDHQKSVADKERANQLKSQSLIDRELKYKEESVLLNQERQSLLDAKHTIERKHHKPFTLLMPCLLLTCIVAGYFSYDFLNTQEQYFEQASVAAKNIDKLAGLLTNSQKNALTASTELQNKQQELVRTRAMLVDLRATTDQLQLEIEQLKSSQDPTGLDQISLNTSVVMLSDQLAILKAQLEEFYLTNDVNEAFIEYQEKDLTIAKKQQQNLQVSIQNKEQKLKETETQTVQLSRSLDTMTNQYLASEARNKELMRQNSELTAQKNTSSDIVPKK